MKLIDIIVGARPNFIKAASIINSLDAHSSAGGHLGYRLVHTGQHYDAQMSREFFDQLAIPEPDINLGVGSGTQSEQTGKIMAGYEELLVTSSCDLCLVLGDVTSTMACAITAQKLNIPVAHVEAGIRSGDWSMPEEINRIVTDAITNWFFTTSETANDNLRHNGIKDEHLFFVGNTMIDTLLVNLSRLRKPSFFKELNLKEGEYFVTTLHRPSNVDNIDGFTLLLDAISESTRDLPVIFPLHPRTAKTVQSMIEVPSNIHLVDPQPYLEFNFLVKFAKAVITDSGGITEETTVMGIPCLTLRDNTERPETVTIGTNELVGTDPSAIKPALNKLFSGQWKEGSIPELWDGKTGSRIVAHLEKLLS